MIDEKVLIERLENRNEYNKACQEEFPNAKMSLVYEVQINAYKNAIEIVKDLASEHNNGWIPCSERLPESEKNGWVSCIVSVVRSHYPTSTYDICDAPYDESIVMHANYDVSQKIWHLECDEQLNALIDIEDAPLNGDYVVAWMDIPAPYKKGE